jgi:hypothetical protein
MTIDQEKNPGEVAKAYKATVLILLRYGQESEKILKLYTQISLGYEELQKELDKENPNKQKIDQLQNSLKEKELQLQEL